VRYLVVYDVVSDRDRAKIAQILLGHGQRVQFSVFECALDQAEARTLGKRLGIVLGEDKPGSSIRFYRVCDRCLARSFGIGQLGPMGDRDPFVVVD